MRRASFLLASVLAHAALARALLPAWQEGETPRLAPAAITVSLLGPQLAAGAKDTHPEASAEPRAHPQEVAVPTKAGIAAAGKTLLPGPRASASQSSQQAGQADDWLPSGKLTRLPVPLDELDLSANAQGYSGRVELVLLVDRYGRVRDVRSRAQDSDSQRFAAALAPRFQAARFSPGEVNGVPVNAVVKIAVVSEAVPATPL